MCDESKGLGKCSFCQRFCGDDVLSEKITERCGTVILRKKPKEIDVLPMKVIGDDGITRPTTKSFIHKP